MTSLVTDAVVLHAFDYLDTSRILRLLTREAGVVSVIARGARRSVRRFGAAMDLFASGTAEIAHRPGRDLHTLLRFEVSDAHAPLAADLDRFMAASMLAELTLHGLRESDHGELFAALDGAWQRLQQRVGAAARLEGLAAAWRLLAALGFAPAVDHCVQCQAVLDPAAEALFSAAMGGALCDLCAGAGRAGRRLPASARAELRTWLAGGETGTLDEATMRAHVRLLREFVERHLTDADLRAVRAWAARFASPAIP